jgi:hypothetical protein
MGHRTTTETLSGVALLAAAVTGTLVAARAPGRWGRPGCALLAGGLSILLARDATMIRSGSLARLQPLPAALLLAETATATSVLALGARRWLSSSVRDRPMSAGSRLATVTFAMHAGRELIYLSPGQGRRVAPS